MEVVIDDIIIIVKEQLRKKSENYTQRKHTTYIKGPKLELKQEVETAKRNNGKKMKEKEVIKKTT